MGCADDIYSVARLPCQLQEVTGSVNDSSKGPGLIIHL